AGALTVTGGINPDGTADGNPITFGVTLAGSTTAVAPGARLGALGELVDGTVASYRAGLDAVAQQLADDLNAVHASGFDLNGAPGLALFGYDPANPAGSLSVLLTDGDLVAASGIAGGGLD